MQFEILVVDEHVIKFRAGHHIVVLDEKAMIELMLALVTFFDQQPPSGNDLASSGGPRVAPLAQPMQDAAD